MPVDRDQQTERIRTGEVSLDDGRGKIPKTIGDAYGVEDGDHIEVTVVSGDVEFRTDVVVTSNRRITIPHPLREKYGVDGDDDVEFVLHVPSEG